MWRLVPFGHFFHSAVWRFGIVAAIACAGDTCARHGCGVVPVMAECATYDAQRLGRYLAHERDRACRPSANFLIDPLHAPSLSSCFASKAPRARKAGLSVASRCAD